ncbi:MAG: channel protein TolC, partial [Proteobacteria bacterium]|nr:channel protein TolC [Pseudomonadota bacterium]
SFDVVIAQHNLGIAQQEVRRHNAENQPTVDAIGSHSFADQGFSSFGKYSAQSTSVGIRFKLPLYKGGGISSRVREAVALQERSRQDLELARRNSAQKTTESFLGVTSGLARVRALEQAVASTQLQLESTKLGQEVGVRTAVDVLNAEQQLTGARRNLYDAVYATIVAQLGLKAAVGRLSESDLESVNRLLN